MGEEHGITANDLGPCPSCGHTQPLMFQTSSEKWWIACGYGMCEHKTKEHVLAIDAGDEWGLV